MVFCHDLKSGHFYYLLYEENVQEESLDISTHFFFHLDFINKNKIKLIMQINLWFGVLTGSTHNGKTI